MLEHCSRQSWGLRGLCARDWPWFPAPKQAFQSTKLALWPLILYFCHTSYIFLYVSKTETEKENSIQAGDITQRTAVFFFSWGCLGLIPITSWFLNTASSPLVRSMGGWPGQYMESQCADDLPHHCCFPLHKLLSHAQWGPGVCSGTNCMWKTKC